MMYAYYFLAQADAITSAGALSANWVLIGITTIAFILFWRMLTKIERNLDKVITSIGDHNTKLQLHESFIEDIDEEIKELKQAIK